jgi:hypothetical protein
MMISEPALRDIDIPTLPGSEHELGATMDQSYFDTMWYLMVQAIRNIIFAPFIGELYEF